MPLKIVRNNIVDMKVEAIVNTANPHPLIGSGVDAAIYAKAGKNLLKEREKIGEIPFGEARITPAFNLEAKYVIHAVTPHWQGGKKKELQILRQTYQNALNLSLKYHIQSIAFPLLASGNMGYPKGKALETAISVLSSFLMEHDMMIYLVVYDRKSYELSSNLFSSVQSFIDENYVEEQEEYGSRCRMADQLSCYGPVMEKPKSLEELVEELDEDFSQCVMRYIKQKDYTFPEVYKRANIDRKLFSKIKNKKGYQPGKNTAIAIAIGLQLNLENTKDLLSKAGFALSHSSKSDVIIEYFIEQGNYDIHKINEVLFEFDQPTLGC